MHTTGDGPGGGWESEMTNAHDHGEQVPHPAFQWTRKVGTLCDRGRRLPVTITAKWDGERLSMTGDIGVGRNLLSCGQISSTLREELPELVNAADGLADLLDAWDAWHLNDMRSGCAHQMADGWHLRPIDPTKPLDSYGEHVPGVSASWNRLAWVRPEEHPDGLLGKPCPTCGYRFGTAWLTEPVPVDVLAAVEAFGRRNLSPTS